MPARTRTKANSARRHQILGVLLLSLATLLLTSLLSSPLKPGAPGLVPFLPPAACGPIGAEWARFLAQKLGLLPALALIPLLALWGVNRLRLQSPLGLAARTAVILSMIGFLAGLLGLMREVDGFWVGGAGSWMAVTATELLGGVGAHVVLWTGLLIALVACLDLGLADVLAFIAHGWFELRERLRTARGIIDERDRTIRSRHEEQRQTRATAQAEAEAAREEAAAAAAREEESALRARQAAAAAGTAAPADALIPPIAASGGKIDFRQLRRQERERLAAQMVADESPPRVARANETAAHATGIDAQAPVLAPAATEGTRLAASDVVEETAPVDRAPATPTALPTPIETGTAGEGKQAGQVAGGGPATAPPTAGGMATDAAGTTGRTLVAAEDTAQPAASSSLQRVARAVADRWRPVAKSEAVEVSGGLDEAVIAPGLVSAAGAAAAVPDMAAPIGEAERVPAPATTVAPKRRSTYGPHRFRRQTFPRGISYRLPSPKTLGRTKQEGERVPESELLKSSRLLERTLSHFDITGKITEVTPGPVITRFAFEPAPGVKVNQILSRADDLALAMRAHRLRILAPIPGKAAVGIEVPNARPEVVRLGDLIQAKVFRKTRSTLLVALGKDVSGVPVVADLERMPHLLIAGATGSGKSVCVNALICSLLLRLTPRQLRLVMVDPKLIELTCYDGIPHLMMPVVTEAKRAARALRYMVLEMQQRYDSLSRLGVRNIEDYNAAVRRELQAAGSDADTSGLPQPLPHVVIIIDELADLMLSLGSEIEDPIARLAQMARAVGIHLVLATQRPSVDVITGMIKANFPSRIAFQVATKVDSRTILDQNGAEVLLGRGDMLYMPAGRPDAIRIHGAYLSDREIHDIVRYWRDFAPPNEEIDLDRLPSVASNWQTDEEEDELFEDARRIIIQTGVGSTSMLQRRLKVGYARAGRLMDLLEQAGIVGPPEGSKAREVLIKPTDAGQLG